MDEVEVIAEGRVFEPEDFGERANSIISCTEGMKAVGGECFTNEEKSKFSIDAKRL